MLEPVGLSALDETIYRFLLAHPGTGADEIAVHADVRVAAARQSLRALESMGLVSRTPGARQSFVAAPPDLALEALVLHREEELKRVRLEAAKLSEAFRDTEQRSHMQPVDLVRGPAATLQRFVQIQRSAKRQVRILDRPPYLTPFPEGPNLDELELLKQGIQYLVLYDQRFFDEPGKLEAETICIVAGEEARLLSDVPLKLVMADRDLALLHDPERVQDSMLIYPSPLLDALAILFELLWERATPLQLAPEDATEETASSPNLDEEILALLMVGAKDETIARRLGLGLRTVRRRVSRLMESLDAKTRFQAGANAVRSGRI